MPAMTTPKRKKADAETPRVVSSVSIEPEAMAILRDYCERLGRIDPLRKNAMRTILSVAIKEYVLRHPPRGGA
jgi:hypothetical protein